MYAYYGWGDYGPDRIKLPFVLIFDNDIQFGQPARVFWSSTEGVATSTIGLVYDADIAQFPTANDTFRLGYFSDYPFDFVTGATPESLISVTMFKDPRRDPNCKAVATFSLQFAAKARTKSESYDPTRGLPILRCYKPGIYQNRLFLLIVPDNLCTGEELWAFFCTTDHNHNTFWATRNYMTVVEDDTSSVTVDVAGKYFDGKVKLNKDDDGWEWISWVKKSSVLRAALEADATDRLSSDGIFAMFVRDDGAHVLSSWDPEPPTFSHAQTSKISGEPWGRSLEQDPSYNYFRRITNTVENNSTDAVLCTLDESGEQRTTKIVTSCDTFPEIMGLYPTGSKIPLGTIEGMLAGAGLYDTFNDPDSPTTAFLFPGEKMTRKTSAKIPNVFNNLSILHVTPGVVNIRTVECGYRSPLKMKELLAEGGFTNLWDVSSTIPSDRTVQENKIVKINCLYPTTSTVALTSTIDDCNVSDGQVFVQDKDGGRTLYNTLKPNSNFAAYTKLFTFHKDKKSVLVYTYGITGRFHDIFLLPGSMIVLLRLRKCRIGGATRYSDLGYYSDNQSGAVHAKLVREAGYYAYYWSSDVGVKGYKLRDLENASITFTGDKKEFVYIPISGWIPWQWMV